MPIAINWTKGLVKSNWALILRQNKTRIGVIKKNIPNHVLSETWTVGETKQKKAQPGKNFFIRLIYERDGQRYHSDSNPFSIIRQPMEKAAAIRFKKPSPDGKTSWPAGERANILWETFGLDIKTEINITLHNAGSNAQISYIGKGSDGAYAWEIPGDLSGYYKLGISPVSKSSGKRKMVAVSLDKQEPIISKRFFISPQLTKLTLKPHIRDRHSRRRENYDYDRKPDDENYNLGSIPGTARVGYMDYVSTPSPGAPETRYLGFVFRSRLFFDVSHLKGKVVSKAYLLLTRKKKDCYNQYQWTQCGTKLFVLEGVWEKPLLCVDTPGYLLKDLPRKDPIGLDITQLVMNWVYGTQENHGLLFAGPKEDFSHPFVGLQKCVNYYDAELRLELYDKTK
jgi:hypothetical protein